MQGTALEPDKHLAHTSKDTLALNRIEYLAKKYRFYHPEKKEKNAGIISR